MTWNHKKSFIENIFQLTQIRNCSNKLQNGFFPKTNINIFISCCDLKAAHGLTSLTVTCSPKEKHQHSLLSAVLCFEKVKSSSTVLWSTLAISQMQDWRMQQLRRGRGEAGKRGGGQEVSLHSNPSPVHRCHAHGWPAEGAHAQHFCSHDKAVA